jgi:NAD(P)-dependent dehydrogenase (short-subunit alcohol dehydrogenase family)
MPLTGKVVVVTGAGGGIGKAIALKCSVAGADLVLASRSRDLLELVADEVTGLGRVAAVVPTDVTDGDSVEALAEATYARFGRVDVLVNNSGIAGPTALTWETDVDEWQETLAVNLTGPWLCCRAFIPRMIPHQSGSIINIGSITGKRPLLGRTPYAATKAGLIGITRTIAEEAGPHGIRVNLVSPGAVEGPRIDRVFEAQAEATGSTPEHVRRNFEKMSPMGKIVTAEEVANAVVFLASDQASAITGIDLNVTNGMVMY